MTEGETGGGAGEKVHGRLRVTRTVMEVRQSHRATCARACLFSPGHINYDYLRGPESNGLGNDTGLPLCSSSENKQFSQASLRGAVNCTLPASGILRVPRITEGFLPLSTPSILRLKSAHPPTASQEEGLGPAHYHRNQVLPATQAGGLTLGASGPRMQSQAPNPRRNALQNWPRAPATEPKRSLHGQSTSDWRKTEAPQAGPTSAVTPRPPQKVIPLRKQRLATVPGLVAQVEFDCL